MPILRLATRKSVLAVTQSTWVKDRLEALNPGLDVELVRITTKGDRILDVPLARIGGKGLFVKDIEEALLAGEADFAVHSLKDVPAEVPEGLEVSVFPEREDARDAFISRNGVALAALPSGSRVGTSSLRRMVQLRSRRPDLDIISLRGNLDTRLRKLDAGEFDAILLAAAGLNRLGLAGRVTEFLDPEVMLPAVGQGALALEFRTDDTVTRRILAPLHHQETAVCVTSERAFLSRLEGGCQVPIGAHAVIDRDTLRLSGLVANEDGTRVIRREKIGPVSSPETLGTALADEILAEGGAEILRSLHET
ncbi:MAG: hydroxymethylbilane synthase [Deltaproteobacteria bacterium]